MTLRDLVDAGLSLDTPVLGKLPMTDDGSIIGVGGVVYLIAENWRDGIHIYSRTADIDLGEPDRRERYADAHNATAKMLEIKATKESPDAR